MKAGYKQTSIVSRTAKSVSVLAVLFLVFFTKFLEAAEPDQETLRAWDEYVRTVNIHITKSAAGGSQFLWIDESHDMAQRVHRNEVIVANHASQSLPQGLIQDWVGAVFVPNVTLDRALRVLENYDRYNEFYKPFLTKCTILAHDGNQIRLNVVAAEKVYSVTAAVETEEQVQVVRLGPKKAYITNNALRVQEIADYGQPTEHPYPESRRPGFVWRQIGVKRLEERDGGVYIELETIVLSRGFPPGFRWLIRPFADEVPRILMLDVLNDTRTAVLQEAHLSPSQELASTGSR